MLIVTVGYRCAIYFESLFCVSPRVFSVVKLTLLLLFSFNFIYSSALICSRGGTAAQQAQHWSLLYLKRYKCATEEEATNERTNKKKPIAYTRLKWKWKLSKFELNVQPQSKTDGHTVCFSFLIKSHSSLIRSAFATREHERDKLFSFFIFFIIIHFIIILVRLPKSKIPILHHFVSHLDAHTFQSHTPNRINRLQTHRLKSHQSPKKRREITN